MSNYSIFVQARLGSTRFPKKVLKILSGKRVLDHVLDSCKSTGLDTFLLVPDADKESFFNENFNVEIFHGSESDVLSRFYECAIKNRSKNIIRITSDCPAITSSHILQLVEEHKKNPGSFVSNVSYEEETGKSQTNIPDGFDIEIFSFDMLELSNRFAINAREREHVTTWMRKNCNVHIPHFSLCIEGKFSLDTREDLDRIERNFEVLKSAKFIRNDL